MAPFDPAAFGTWASAAVHLGIGAAFGFLLERAGFGDARKLTAQFYLRDMSVLKVMFTAIVTAAVLIAAATTFGLLDYDRLWINPTYLWPGIVGGLIFGVGFVVGGYCPGTALVGAATLKLDAVLFIVGVLGGIFAFGFTEKSIDPFWNGSTNLGKLTLSDWLGISQPTAVLLVVLLALAFFAFGEWIERLMNRGSAHRVPSGWRARRPALIFAVTLLAASLSLVLVWGRAGALRSRSALARAEAAIVHQKIQIDASELSELMRDHQLALYIFDLRDEADFNRFHLLDAERVEPSKLAAIFDKPNASIKILVGVDDQAPTAVYRTLSTNGVENAYILSGGIRSWTDRFGPSALDGAVGDRCPESRPLASEHTTTARIDGKVKPPGAARRKSGGGCGG